MSQMSFHRLSRWGLLMLILSLAVTFTQAQTETWWQKFLRITGVSATPSKQRGSSQTVESGYIWIANLEEKTSPRLTDESGYRSPVFVDKDQNVLALKNDEVVRIPVSGGQVQTLFTIKGAIKLVGLSLDDPDKLLMLIRDKDAKINIGLLSLTTGQITPVPYETTSPEGKSMFAHLSGWNRVYCNTEISLAENNKTDRSGRITQKWTDVYVKRAYREAINVSNCNGVNCGQPSLSQDGMLVAFIKAER
jgi:hypothetical protein